MAYPYFERKGYSSFYQKYMIREPLTVHKLILSYLEEKGNPFGLAVDLGCGTGESTRFLAPHFQKVVGIDISEAQIREAESVGTFHNVSYVLAPAEKLPFQDHSVDMVTASAAAHWFNTEEFLREVDRVLKPGGSLAFYCPLPQFDLCYKDCSQRLTDTFVAAFDFLFAEYGGKIAELVKDEYKHIFDSVPFEDKTRVTKILRKSTMSVVKLLGFVESVYLFQLFLSTDSAAAVEFLQNLKDRILNIMGTSSAGTELEFSNYYCCVLACKSPK
ncbi:putative methyltransferase DDB_G0268948 [Ambystoma mexicanum]|uniref:putative methyltransferase DDB_G0268948 n=1 Tax=Ambystoma mexicanum TaxID=8296 RepID=UPI0037E77427